MAIIGVNQPGAEPQKESGLDKVLKGIQIAQGVMGTALAIPKFMQEREDFKQQAGYRKAQIDKLGAEQKEIELNLGPPTPQQLDTAKKLGAPLGSIRTFKQADEWIQRLTETPGQKESRRYRDIQIQFMREASERAARAEAREIARQNKPKELSQATIANIQEGNEIPRQLETLTSIIEKNIDLFGPVEGRKGAANVYNEAAQLLQTQIKNRAQAFGRFMEGGVLRKEDEAKYEKMFPNITDAPGVARGKLKIVKEIQREKQKSLIKAYKDQGFDMSGLEDQFVETITSQDAEDF